MALFDLCQHCGARQIWTNGPIGRGVLELCTMEQPLLMRGTVYIGGSSLGRCIHRDSTVDASQTSDAIVFRDGININVPMLPDRLRA
jgi:hypothetical protein